VLRAGLSGYCRAWRSMVGDARVAFARKTDSKPVTAGPAEPIGGLGGKAWADDPISGLRALTGKEAEQAMWSATHAAAACVLRLGLSP